MSGERAGGMMMEAQLDVVRLATLPADGPTGTFQDENGPVPW